MGDVALQWSLDQTSNSIIGVSAGILRAATSDNVQPLALLSCEQFGTNLAMSPESRHKVSLLCDRTHTSATLKFLNAQIGYFKGDCGYHLAQSDAGLRFLGLAACLSTLDHWNAALILHKLIYDTARDKTLVPTEQHLKQLLVTLDTKLARSGFCEDIFGWARLIRNDLGAEAGKQDRETNAKFKEARLPPLDTIGALVNALSALARVGDEDSRIRIVTPAPEAAWYIAFVKWCLGEPPRIISHGKSSLSQATLTSTSRVSVEVLGDIGRSQLIRVEAYDQVGDLKDLIEAATSTDRARGLVSIATYGEMKLRERFGEKASLQYQACIEALPYACSIVRDMSYAYSPEERGNRSRDKLCRAREDDDTMPGGIFPSDEILLRAIQEYQGFRHDPTTVVLSEIGTMSLWDLPQVSLALERLSQSCTCTDCLSQYGGKRCLVLDFQRKISQCVADILALSLVRSLDPEGVQLWYGSSQSGKVGMFPFIVRGMLNYKPTDPEDPWNDYLGIWLVMQHVCELLGHDYYTGGKWLVSSFHDQTIYPQVFSTQVIGSVGIFTIDCIPGSINYGHDRYNVVKSAPLYQHRDLDDDNPARSDVEPEAMQTSPTAGSSATVTSQAVLTPRDNFSGHQTKWKVARKEARLEATISLPTFPTSPDRDPENALNAAALSIFVNCQHDVNAAFPLGQYRVHEISPDDPWTSDGNSIAVLQSDQNDPVRFFALAAGRPCVVRMDACVECCIKCSVLNDLPRVIL